MHITPTNLRSVTFADRPALIHSASEVPHSMAHNIAAVTQSFLTQQPTPFQQKSPEIKAQERAEGFQFKLATQQRIEPAIER
ncbi:hypothetical protein LDO51_15490 [Providencia alcalifaciens]|uniref:hypothetical protein n=1 Tax=Providencia alcalifaciens TaxID=126385 RepID=UPI001CE18DC4|nr:hypothetical protein [Providencia alcalifaciens]UBX48536.1 hypothetical protein LDO51_15490 [Providencia alcalifaciens]